MCISKGFQRVKKIKENICAFLKCKVYFTLNSMLIFSIHAKTTISYSKQQRNNLQKEEKNS